MSAVVVVANPGRPDALATARRAVRWLADHGHEVRMAPDDAVGAGVAEAACPPEGLAPGADLALSLGGDGTMLRTVAQVAAHEVPVLGVNHGQLGYLTEVEPDQLEPALERFLAGDHHLEERMLLEVVIERQGRPPERLLALNESVLEKTIGGHTVRIEVDIDGAPFTPYEADGLIVATPTGSTAYAFSARGPIVAPTHRALLLTPVSPHMLFDRTLVLEPETRLRLVVRRDRPAALSIDGRSEGELADGDAVTCTAAAEPVRFVTFGRRDFPSLLKAKFGLSDR